MVSLFSTSLRPIVQDRGLARTDREQDIEMPARGIHKQRETCPGCSCGSIGAEPNPASKDHTSIARDLSQATNLVGMAPVGVPSFPVNVAYVSSIATTVQAVRR